MLFKIKSFKYINIFLITCLFLGVISLPAQAEITAEAIDDSITMLAPYNTSVDPANNTWILSLNSGTVKENISKSDLEIDNLPAGLDYSLRKGIGNNIIITVQGSASSAVSAREVGIIIKSSAVSNENFPDSLQILVQIQAGAPRLLSKHPHGDGQWFDESLLHPRKITDLDQSTRYFLMLSYADPDGTLIFEDTDLSRLKTSYVYSEGGSKASMIDMELLNYISSLDEAAKAAFINTYLFNKSANIANLYIPIKRLRPQTEYTNFINAGIIGYPNGMSNESLSWSFKTMAVPTVTGISIGSVGEDYDIDKAIIIYGDYFYTNGMVKVWFNDTAAREVRVINENGKSHLKVYLPSGRDRLKPGMYNVTVKNSENHQQTLIGRFSVVKASDLPAPADGLRIKKQEVEGDVVETIGISEDTLRLSSRYANSSFIELHLDELMGEHVVSRKIKWEAFHGEKIKELYLNSRWADAVLYGVILKSHYSKDEIEIRTGRIPASLVQSLRLTLFNRTIKSNLIEVDGENFYVERLDLRIPYQQSSGDNLKVLRYDRSLRTWYEVPFVVNQIDQRVIVRNVQTGIFVVVE